MSRVIPWDVYIDERKEGSIRWLGCLVIPNSPSFMHKLHRCRDVADPTTNQVFHRAGEVHFHAPRGDLIPVALKWIEEFFKHRGTRFFRVAWPLAETKAAVVIRFMVRFCRTKRLQSPFGVVVFLDFDSAHASSNIQNAIRQTANIARCYHLDSRNNDLLQCADLILGAYTRLAAAAPAPADYADLHRRWSQRDRLKDSEVKNLWIGHLAKLLADSAQQQLPSKIVDIQ